MFERILAWDMEREKAYCANRLGYHRKKHLDEMELEYKKFIFLVLFHHDTVIPISEKVDDLWHAHVLHTRHYAAFCKMLGRQIHHNPTITDDENIALMPAYEKNTLPLYRRYFGEPPKDFWIKISARGACCTH
jgi:hypothetical protein